MKLLVQGLTKLLLGAVLLGVLIFVPAGTLRFPNGWLMMGLLFVPMIILGALLLIKAPALLEKRLNNKEKEKTQKGVVGISALLFLAVFVLSGLDFRFGWSHMPQWVVAFAALVQLAAYGMYAGVMAQNAYLSRTIEVQEGQKVVDTGMYAVIRHPMYTATILLFLAMAAVLGAWIGVVIMLVYPAVLVVRIRNEEQMLKEGLPGYADYMEKVKYRLIPYIW